MKNIIVLVPWVMVGSFDQLNEALCVTIAFCLLSSAIYCLNDVFDAEHDRLNPSKRGRPIPSGRISQRAAKIFGSVLALVSLWIVYYVASYCLPLFVCYVIVNAFYSVRGKDIPILDVSLVALGFVLRFLVGCTVVQDSTLYWLAIPIYLGSMSLAFGKRLAKLSRMKASNRTPDIYTKSLLTGLLLSTSYTTLLSIAWILLRKGPGFVDIFPVNEVTTFLLLFVAIALLSRTTFLMAFRYVEPAQAFFEDVVTVAISFLGLVLALSVKSLVLIP